jgi:hypothetical protein
VENLPESKQPWLFGIEVDPSLDIVGAGADAALIGCYGSSPLDLWRYSGRNFALA